MWGCRGMAVSHAQGRSRSFLVATMPFLRCYIGIGGQVRAENSYLSILWAKFKSD